MDTLYTAPMQQHLERIETYLPVCLPEKNGLADVVAEAMAYACATGGKRIRPVLTMEFCRACGGQQEESLPFAAAVEMIHSYSLIHDDLPCMDNSPLRRGKPSVHKAFGEDMALLAGDALLNRAFEILLRPTGLSADRQMRAACTLADAAGIGGMVGGQVLDLESEGKTISLEMLERLQEGKTAALMIASCRMGVIAAGGSEERIEAAGVYGREIGLCFQIVDDILDETVSAQQLGKPVGSDAQNQKNTYVSLLGLDEARALAKKRTQSAIEALKDWGDEADGLRRLAQALLIRTR